MSILPFFQWCGETVVGITIRDSFWLFPVIQCVHLLGLAMIGGVVLVVDLRLLGLGLRRQSVAQLAADVRPWFVGSLLVLLVSGVLLFTSETRRMYDSPPFWWKMGLLVAAVTYTLTIRRRVVELDETRPGPIWRRLVALVSLGLWFGVGFSGRWIAFY